MTTYYEIEIRQRDARGPIARPTDETVIGLMDSDQEAAFQVTTIPAGGDLHRAVDFYRTLCRNIGTAPVRWDGYVRLSIRPDDRNPLVLDVVGFGEYEAEMAVAASHPHARY